MSHFDEVKQATIDAEAFVLAVRAFIDAQPEPSFEANWIRLAALEAYMHAWVNASGYGDELRKLWKNTMHQDVWPSEEETP